jgi:tetratricopeptide (TPR) repeat protein
MPESSLDGPDDLAQPYDPRWSPTVALALQRAYGLLRRRAYRQALACMRPFETSARADLQRMRVHYVLGTCLARLENVREAIGHLDEAVAIAERNDDLAACASLAYLEGQLHYEAQSIASAAEYFQIALDALATLPDSRTSMDGHDARLELDILGGLASQYFLLDQHGEALATIARAHAIAQLEPTERRRRASLEWIAALVERWRGNPYDARDYAKCALAEYRQEGGLNELARIEVVLADIELDLAARAPAAVSGSRELSILAQADVHIREALAHARACGDRGAEGLALRSRARYARLYRPRRRRTSLDPRCTGDRQQLAGWATARPGVFGAGGRPGSIGCRYLHGVGRDFTDADLEASQHQQDCERHGGVGQQGPSPRARADRKSPPQAVGLLPRR